MAGAAIAGCKHDDANQNRRAEYSDAATYNGKETETA
jgi:hypothetical protein